MNQISSIEIGEVEQTEDGWEVIGHIGGEPGSPDHEHTVKIGMDLAAGRDITEIRLIGTRGVLAFAMKWIQTDEGGEESVTEFINLADLDVLTAAEREGIMVDIVGGER